MPELPEVETVRRVLEKWVVKKTIKDVFVYYKPICEDDLSVLKGQKINKIERVGKNLIFYLDKYVLTSHLRMEGKYYYALKKSDNLVNGKLDFDYKGNEDLEKVRKHGHIFFLFTDDSLLIYHDVRKFGRMHLYEKDSFSLNCLKLGKEPFKMSSEELYQICSQKKLPIKELLLDQSLISGLGNIYVDEVCYRSCLLPTRLATTLTLEDCNNIIKNAIEVLNQAIEKGGSTIKTYHSGNGVDGLFQNNLLVYGKNGKPCQKCGTTILKIRLKGRGTCFCPNCQK